jgi:hypothetical protein
MKYILSIIFLFVFSFAAYGQTCSVTLSTNSASVSASYFPSRIVPIDITAPNNCAWSSANNPSWIAFSTNDQALPTMQTISGSGNARVYAFAVVNNGDSRTGTFTINNQTFTVTQGNDCFYSLGDQSPHGFSAAGGSFFLPRARNGGYVTNCTVTYTTDAAWIHIGTTDYTVDANFGAARSATILLNYADKPALVYTVNQAAGAPPPPTPPPACTYALGTLSQSFSSSGGTGSIDVQTQAGCVLSSISNNDFITVTNSSGAGSGTVGFTVAANNTSYARTGTINAQGQTFTITQAGVPKSRKRVRFF